MNFDYDKLLFPYKNVRQYQDALIQNVFLSLENRKTLIAHAPTGLGKTSAVLSPALAFALQKDLNIFFLTPRHTQHKMVIETLKEISKAHHIKISVLDLINKQEMCPMEASKELDRNDFIDYCKDMRKTKKCPYYRNTRKEELTDNAKRVLEELSGRPLHSNELVSACVDNKLCPYEIGLELGKKAKVVVCDYFHLFKNEIRNSLLARTGKVLDESIIIIDEAHNLPDRVRSLMTSSLTTYTLNAAINELVLHKYDEEADSLRMLLRVFEGLVSRYDKEGIISRDDLLGELEALTGISTDELVSMLINAGNSIREEKKKSFALAVARFLDEWSNDDPDRIRIIKREKSKRGNEYISLTYHCINPAEYTAPVFRESYSSVLMSGTLTPTSMYAEVLGIDDAQILELKSPFPQENRLTLIVPETTTKYSRRSDKEFKRIAEKIFSIVQSAQVSTAVFFPSYYIRDRVYSYFNEPEGREVLLEKPGLTKDEKNALLNKFRLKRGSILFGVVSGSFGEGVDLPGSELECIIIVGVPLPPPDLFTKSLINYYEEKFGKGWDYGYTYPALTKVIQSAGRCIRRSNDRGLIVLLDERYAWENYMKCIPPDWIVRITKNPEKFAKEFFKHQE